MNYTEVLNYLEHKLPMFQRIGKEAFKADLTNIKLLCQYLDNPQQQFKSIHIAGTNGKGSTAHILAAILQESGYKVGLHTSPHYHDMRERIKINGELIGEEEVIFFVEKYKTLFEQVKPSFFELSVAMTFYFFAKKNVDIAIIETGLGGRLDATNIIEPLLSIITNISLEHTAFLGNTLAEIATEKAGIIKPQTPAIISETQKEIKAIFEQKTIENQATIYFADENLIAKNIKYMPLKTSFDVYKKQFDNTCLYENIETDLLGHYQIKNMIGVLQATEILQKIGFEKIKQQTIFSALKKVQILTNFMGRWQILSSQKPIIIADSSHNEAGLRFAMQQLTAYHFENLHLVLGFVKGKETTNLWEFLPQNATYYFCCANIPRALPTDILRQKAKQYNLKCKVCFSVKHAFEMAKKNAKKQDIIYIGGSNYVVAEII
ncbi:MAG: bifunctional folylpolyglutamate synthase/dihydrofolate synthase [Chitinophagales bacterium]